MLIVTVKSIDADSFALPTLYGKTTLQKYYFSIKLQEESRFFFFRRAAAAMSCRRGTVRCRASMAAVNRIQFFFNIISDSKRQQTTTVDYKRLTNGFVLTGFASLQRKQ